jgi:hypothetical protein
MRVVERMLRVFVGVAGLGFTVIAVGIILSDGPTVTFGRIWLYGSPVLAVGLFGLLLTLARLRHMVLVLINGLAVLAAVYGVEFYLSVPIDTPLSSVTAAQSLRTFAAELRNTGVRAYPHVCPSALTGATLAAADGSALLPLGGLSDNLLVALDGTDVVTRRSDQYGFNNPKDQWNRGSVDVMAVGDSFTFGADVPFGKSFMDLLRQDFGRVVSLGCGGNGPLSELASLIEYGNTVRPKTLIWAYYESNDLTKDLRRELNSPILQQYLDGKFVQRLAVRQNEIDDSLELFVLARLAKKNQPEKTATSLTLREVLLLTKIRTALGLSCGFDRRQFRLACDFHEESLDQFGKILETAAKRVEEWDGRLVFVYLPGPRRYTSWFANIDADGSRNAVLRLVEKLSIDRVDVHEVFLRHAEPSTLFHGHYTEEGYALVADAILARLRDE